MSLLLVVLLGVVGAAVARGVRDWDADAARRVAPMLGGLAAAAGLFALIGGVESGGAIAGSTAFIVLGPLLGYLASRGRTARVAEGSWSGAGALVGSGAPAGRGASTTWSVARALGRVEARELATSVWFGVGLGFCALMYAIFGFVYSSDNNESWTEYIQIAPWFVHPMVGMCVVAAHRAVTRARRDGADELFDTCPADPVARTSGFLLAAVVPLVTLAAFLTALLVTTGIRSTGLHGPIGGDGLADLLAAVVLGAGGVALGVALAGWVRFGLAPIVAVVAVALATTALNGVGGPDWNPLVSLATAPTVEGPSPVFQDRATGWHLVWVIGLVALVSVVAVVRHRRDRAVGVAAAAACAVVLVAGIGATRPLSSASAERIAALVAHPEAHQDCVTLDGPVTVCAFGLHRELLDRAVTRARPVARALPAGFAPMTLRQRFDGELADLPPEVRRRLEPRDLSRPDGEVPLGFGEDDTYLIGDAGFDLAMAAVGLPTEADAADLPAVAAGQARGVVAIWLATRGLGPADAAELSSSPDAGSTDPFANGSLEGGDPGDCSVPAVVWSAQDLAAARAVMALPETAVAGVISREWERWSDPRTGTDELLAALGLPAAGPFDRVVPRPGNPC